MRVVPVAMILLLSSSAIAAENGRSYLPRLADTSAPAAVQVADRGEPTSCSGNREVLACVVPLGPRDSDTWSYPLVDQNGVANSETHYQAASVGAPCKGMAYPTGDYVAVVGGAGDWFPGKVYKICRK